MTLVCGLDFETTGFSNVDDRIIEVGAVAWDWENQKPILMISDLVNPHREIPAEITQITGITQAEVELFGREEISSINDLTFVMGSCSYVMAHQASFDEGFYRAARVRHGIPDPGKPFLCSMYDIKYENTSSKRLSYIAADHGFLNPFAHRALFDVLTMLRVASDYPLDAIVARALEPVVLVSALVSYEERKKASDRGYYWYPPLKMWWKVMKESDYEQEVRECGFPTVLQDPNLITAVKDELSAHRQSQSAGK